MPTASTSQILGNNECFEPYTSNIYSRRVMSGEFAIVNPHLLKELTDRGIWDSKMKNRILADKGSVQNISEIPQDVRDIYKTVWELKMRVLIDMAADRGAFIDQSQSLNLFVAAPTTQKLTSMHFYSWKKGLKTGCYYLRTRPAVDAIQFTVDKVAAASQNKQKMEEKENIEPPTLFPPVTAKMDEAQRLAYEIAKMACSRDNPGACEMCSG